MHASQLFLLLVRQLGLFASESALRASDLHALTRAQANQVRLKLRKGGQDVEEHLAHGVGWIIAALAECQIPRLARSSAIERASRTERASRSSFGTTSVSPLRTAASAWFNPGCARFIPVNP
jgi:hypothetical protein